jgi:hypothetical protein
LLEAILGLAIVSEAVQAGWLGSMRRQCPPSVYAEEEGERVSSGCNLSPG